jgi:hypothetical protein
MNQQIKQKWVDALTNRKYEQQTDGVLQDCNGWCCLGVLCDIYAKEKGITWEISCQPNGTDSIHGETELLPKEVVEWAEFKSDETNVTKTDVIVNYIGRENSISVLNDSYELPFEEIASLIQEQL